MNETITINMENLSEEERKQLIELVEKSNKEHNKVWKPADREKYYYIRNDGDIYKAFFENYSSVDCDNYSIGNCFRTEKEANFAVEKLKVIADLKRFAEGKNDKELDWNDVTQSKYWLQYDCNQNKILIFENQFLKHNDIYFSSEKIAKEAIETIGKGRIKKYYFEVK